MSERVSVNPEIARRSEYAKRIIAAVNYKGCGDREDVHTILCDFQKENLNLINNQKEEIKQVNRELSHICMLYDELKKKTKTAKVEAYKECIEKVKAYYKETRFDYDTDNLCEDLDNLLKETVGEDNGKEKE